MLRMLISMASQSYSFAEWLEHLQGDLEFPGKVWNKSILAEKWGELEESTRARLKADIDALAHVDVSFIRSGGISVILQTVHEGTSLRVIKSGKTYYWGGTG